MSNILTFERQFPSMTRRQFFDDLLALGRETGDSMSLEDVIKSARECAWREATHIAEDCCDRGCDYDDRDFFPIVSTVDPDARDGLARAAALVVACDRMLAELAGRLPRGGATS